MKQGERRWSIWKYELRVTVTAEGTVTKSYWVHHGNQWNPEGPFQVTQQAFSKATNAGKSYEVTVQAGPGVVVR